MIDVPLLGSTGHVIIRAVVNRLTLAVETDYRGWVAVGDRGKRGSKGGRT